MGFDTGSGSQQQQSGPWSGQQPYLKDIYSKAQDWHGGQQPLAGSEGVQQDVFNRVQGNLGGSEQERALGNRITSSLSGDDLGGNPYLDDTFNRASGAVSDKFRENVVPGLNSSFSMSGGTGGSAHALALGDAAGGYGDALGNLATDIYGGAYEGDRNRQVQYAGLVPGYEGLQDRNVGQYAGYGDQEGDNLSKYKSLIGNAIQTSSGGGSKDSFGVGLK